MSIEMFPDDTDALIRSSGCPAIQDAIAAIEDSGYSLSDLSQETIETVVGVIASADSVEAEAAPKG